MRLTPSLLSADFTRLAEEIRTVEEAGAHVEYLYQRGELVAENVGELESEQDPVVRYVRA